MHNSKAHVRSLSQVQTDPKTRATEVHDGPGYVADVEHFELDDPAYFRDFAEEVYALSIPAWSIPDGPIQQNRDGSFGVGQGYCFAFSHEALRIILAQTSARPSWQELQPEAQYLPPTQEATDVGEGARTALKEARPGPERKEQERKEQAVARIVRDSGLARQVKEKAGYRCQVCGEPPIELPDGSLYAEAHHLKPLSDGGPDASENIICACPSCHVKLDYGTVVLGREDIAGASRSQAPQSRR